MTYGISRIIPIDHPIYKDYVKFKQQFGQDGNVMVLGVQTSNIFQLDFFNRWYEFGNEIKNVEGIEDIISVAHVISITKDQEKKKFKIDPIFPGGLTTQHELDSLKDIFLSLPFYKGVIYNEETNASLMAITFNRKMLDSKKRIGIVNEIAQLTADFSKRNNVEIHESGLPFLRNYRTTQIASELKLFLFLALIITAILLFLLFKSLYPVFFPMLVVVIGVIWSIGLIVMLGYKITLLTGLVPALIVVIGIPNCIYFLNKYHGEFKKHKNKIKALSRVIEKIGHITFFTNLTTAIGFTVFYLTRSKMLEEFGSVAGLSLAVLFLISLILIPVVFSFLPPPNVRQTIHLDNILLNKTLHFSNYLVNNHRRKIYIFTSIVLLMAIFGMFRLNVKGFIFDDIPFESKPYKDLKFFEGNFRGVMPFEVIVDTKKKGGVQKLSALRKIDEVQTLLSSHDIFSKPLSLVDGQKFCRQAFYNGNPGQYRLPNELEKSFINKYLSSIKDQRNLINSFVDSNKQIARISVQIADIGSEGMPLLLDTLRPRIESILDTGSYNVSITGTSIIATEGYNYLFRGLLNSVAFALLLIALIMVYLFRSWKMLLFSLVPNLIPLIITAAIMGYFNIYLKPSTVLIFSIAFGISVDFTIHFLARFHEEYGRHNWDIKRTVTTSLHENGVSMIYTALTLFFGFIIFTVSDFGGTFSLGLLTSITLVVATFTNLVLLPSLLMSFEKQISRKALKEPLLTVFDEEEDIELEKLELIK